MQGSMVPFVFMDPDQFREHWQGHRRLTRRTIERFPEDQLFTYAQPPVRTFGEMTHELLGTTVPLLQQVTDGKWATPEGLPDTREGLLEAWDEATEAIDRIVPEIGPTRLPEPITAFGQYESTVRDSLLYVLENEIHHRAQGYVYLRALGVEPPYFWERD